MKIAYLILAHNTPHHMKRLIKSLSSDSSSFFIHLDKKVHNKEFLGIEGNNVCFTQERVPVFWGDFSQVEAILVLLRTAFYDQRKFDRFVLLSGADFPLRSAANIEKFFLTNKNKEYINLVEMPSVAVGKPISRLTTYKLRPGDGKIINTAKKVLIKIGILPCKRDYRKFLLDLTPYGGSTWWALTREAVDYILRFIHEKPQVVHFFKNTVCPDEAFFQTILGNSDHKLRIVGNLTYTDWSAGGQSPANISEKHLVFFKSTSHFGEREMLFARKFTDDSENLVSMLEDQVRETEDRLTDRST